mmetsp:Transcript_92515/g.200005  ORF Transcript_92515/g.200005 Transcript_92515/m.200005 type:complete len:231 (+) Transcript_92515:866-1558(+)
MYNTITCIQKDLESSNVGYEKIKAANQELRAELRSLTNANKEMKVELDEKDQIHDKKVTELNQKYEYILNNLNEENERCRGDMDQLHANAEQKSMAVTKLEEQLKATSKELEALKSHNTQKSAQSNMEVTHLKNKVNDLAGELEQKSHQLAQVHDQLHYTRAKTDEDLIQFTSKISDLEHNLNLLNNKMNEKDNLVSNLKNKLVYKDNEINDLKDKFNSMQSQGNHMNKD